MFAHARCRRMGPLRIAVASCVLLSSLEAFGEEQSEGEKVTASLEWIDSGESACLTAPALREAVEKHLGRPVFAATEAADVGLQIRVESKATKLRISVDVKYGDTSIGMRTLEGGAAECASLRESLVLVVAMLLDVPRDELDSMAAAKPEQNETTTPQKKPERVVPPPPVAPVERPKPVGRRARPVASPWHVQANALAALDYRVLPELAGGAILDLFVEPPDSLAVVRLAAAALPSVTISRAGGSATFDALMMNAGIGISVGDADDRAAARLWLLGGAARVFAQTNGFDDNRNGSVWFATVGPGAAGIIRFSNTLLAIAELEMFVPMSHGRFVYAASDGSVRELHTIPGVAVNGGLGVGWNMP